MFQMLVVWNTNFTWRILHKRYIFKPLALGVPPLCSMWVFNHRKLSSLWWTADLCPRLWGKKEHFKPFMSPQKKLWIAYIFAVWKCLDIVIFTVLLRINRISKMRFVQNATRLLELTFDLCLMEVLTTEVIFLINILFPKNLF